MKRFVAVCGLTADEGTQLKDAFKDILEAQAASLGIELHDLKTEDIPKYVQNFINTAPFFAQHPNLVGTKKEKLILQLSLLASNYKTKSKKKAQSLLVTKPAGNGGKATSNEDTSTIPDPPAISPEEPLQIILERNSRTQSLRSKRKHRGDASTSSFAETGTEAQDNQSHTSGDDQEEAEGSPKKQQRTMLPPKPRKSTMPKTLQQTGGEAQQNQLRTSDHEKAKTEAPASPKKQPRLALQAKPTNLAISRRLHDAKEHVGLKNAFKPAALTAGSPVKEKRGGFVMKDIEARHSPEKALQLKPQAMNTNLAMRRRLEDAKNHVGLRDVFGPRAK